MNKPASRKEAKALGLKRYFTGKACPNGHVMERLASNGQCRGCGKVGLKAYAKRHPERMKERAHKSYLRNKDKVNQRVRDRRLRDPGYDKRRRVAYRLADPNYRKQYNKEWRQAHPEAVRSWWRTRRALKYNAEGAHTERDLFVLFVVQDAECVCGKSLLESCTIDHKTPLSRGGSNWPDNLQLLCQFCNDSKGAKTEEEWNKWKTL